MRDSKPTGALEPLERRTMLSFIPVGGEFRVNTATLGVQRVPVVASDADGDFVVAWQGDTSAGSGIFLQRFNAAGVPQGAQAQVPTPPLFQRPAFDPEVAMDDDGDFVVAWRQAIAPFTSYAIYALRYNAAGVPQGEWFVVNNNTTSSKRNPSVAMDADGDFVIAWDTSGQDGDQYGIYARRYNALGVPASGEFRANAHTAGSQSQASVAMRADGQLLVTWSGAGAGEVSGVFARLFGPSNVPLGDQFQVHAPNAVVEGDPAVARHDGGNFVVAWTRENPAPDDSEIFARRFSSTGEPLGDEFLVNTYTNDDQANPAVAFDADGNFVVTWDSYDQDFQQEGVYAQRFDASGAPRGGEVQVNTYWTNWQAAPAIAMDDAGDFVITWMSDRQDGSLEGVYAQRFASVPAVRSSSFLYATAPHRVRFAFDQNVSASLGADDLVLENLTTGQTIPSSNLQVSYDTATNEATFRYTGAAGGIVGVLPDGNYRATLRAAGVTNGGGTPLASDLVFNFTFLQGDATGDARVNLDDFNVLAANFGQGGRDFTQGDFSYDGVVNLDDFNILASRFGSALGPREGFAAPRPGAGSDGAWKRVADDQEDDQL